MIAYGGIGIVIHGNSIIGKNCMIGQGITIGGKSGDKNEILRGYGGTPIIEDNVYSGIPEKIIIKITKENIEKYRDYGVRNCETVI